MLHRLWQAMISEEGQAVAAWGANILSTVALGIALAVAIVERRRSHRDLLRAVEQEKTRRLEFVNTALDVSQQAVSLMNSAYETFDEDYHSVDRRLDPVGLANELERGLRPLHDVARALQQAAPLDADIAVNLSKICRAMEESWDETIAFQGGYGNNVQRRTGEIKAAAKLLYKQISLE